VSRGDWLEEFRGDGYRTGLCRIWRESIAKAERNRARAGRPSGPVKLIRPALTYRLKGEASQVIPPIAGVGGSR
jgi:hypothetical protein